MVTIITGTTNKNVSSERLKNFFREHGEYEGVFYIGYPIIGTSLGPFRIDAAWISPQKGLVLFHLIEGKGVDGYKETQDNYVNKMEAKLRGYDGLMEKRVFRAKVSVITYAPLIKASEKLNKEYPLCNDENLKSVLDGIIWDCGEEYYGKLLSVIQAISSIKKGRKREILSERSRGAKLSRLEDSIANLDNMQGMAVIETVNGVQRIRGLAGSGKTIVLALKAAYLHTQHPDWDIAVTFNTRSLKGQFRRLINTFSIEQANEEPNWDKLQIIHAWGSSGGGENNGIFYNFCKNNNVQYRDYSTAKREFGGNDTFGKTCERALFEAGDIKKEYDVILVDEAQDFSEYFLRLCYEILREPKRMVYAYDELQNLRLQSLPSPEQIFGSNPDGTPRVRMDETVEKQDIILGKCYRNSRPILATAHGLGFGIYREKKPTESTGLVQMFERSSLWSDIGYEIYEGELQGGKNVGLRRTDDSSPRFLEEHSSIDDIIQFISFSSKKEQDEWVAAQIMENLNHDELRADDIMVINTNPLTTRENVAPIRSMLFRNQIKSHTVGVDTALDVFFEEEADSVAFSGIYRAKGNEAAMVYIVNSEYCFDADYEKARIRNLLFTAITRSKAWVRVLGVGKSMERLKEEFEKIREHDFSLNFIYPTDEQLKHLNIVNRDMSQTERRKVNNSRKSISELILGLQSGDLHKEDFSESQIEELKKLLK